MIRRRFALLLGVMVLAVLAACGSSGDRAPRSEVMVEPRTPAHRVVPGSAPAGLVVDDATTLEPGANGWDRMVLYGEPTGEDPADGVQIVALKFSGQGGLRCAAGANVQQCGHWMVAEGHYPDCFEDCFAYLLGRNVTKTDLERALAGADFHGNTPSIRAEALPAGVRRLVVAPATIDGLRAPGAQVVSYQSTGTTSTALSVTAVDGGGALADLYRFFVAEDGSMLPFESWLGSPSLGRVRLDGDTVIAVLGSGIDRRELDRFAESVHRDDGDEWSRLRHQATTLPVDVLLPGGGEFLATVAGRYSVGQWAVGLRGSPPVGHMLEIRSNGPDPSDDQGSGATVTGVGSGDHLVRWMSGFGGSTSFSGTMLAGVTPAPTASVTVVSGDRQLEAALSGPTSLPGAARLWAVFVEHRDAAPPPATVVARSADGRELGRVAS